MRDVAVEVSVDLYQVIDAVTQRGEQAAMDLVIAIDEDMCELSFSEKLRDYFIVVCAKEYAADEEVQSPKIPWPFNIEDPVRAVHYAKDHDCPYVNPHNCPDEENARKFIAFYEEWKAHNQ